MNSNYCQTTLVMTFCYFAFVFLFLALFLIGKNDWLWTFSMIFKYEKPCWTKRPNLTRRPDSFLSVYNSDLLTVFQDLLLWRESVTAGRFMVRELKWFVSTFYFSFSSCCFSLSMCTFKVFFFFPPFSCNTSTSECQTNFLSPSPVGFRWQAFKSSALLVLEP